MNAVDAAAVEPLLRGSFGRPLYFEAVCESTQDVLRGSGLPEGAVAITDHQTAGRGRSGGVWEDTQGEALLFSLLLRPPAGAVLPQLSLVCGLAVAESVEAVAGVVSLVKWPNDVLLDDAKIAGILLEGDGDAVVCGIGLNVNQVVVEPAAARLPATSLRAVTDTAHDRAAVLAMLLETLERHYRTWLAGGLERLLPALEARNALRGRRIRCGAGIGVAGSFAPDGRLEVTLDTGTEAAIESGTIDLLD